jgi:hypothetical protein
MVAFLTRGTGLDKKAAPADGTRMLLATLTAEIQQAMRRGYGMEARPDAWIKRVFVA